MGVVYKRKDSPYWWLAYKKGDRRVREAAGTKSLTLAREILRRREAAALFSDQTNLKYDKKEITSFIKEYLDWIKVNRRPHTYRSYNTILKALSVFLEDRGGIKYLNDITPKTLEDYKQHRLAIAKTTTLKNHVIVLKALFGKVVEWGYLTSNPAKNLKGVEITDSKPIRVLAEDEYRYFMEVCKRDFPKLYPMFYTFIHTGLRKTELLSLEWGDIDLERGLIYIRPKEGFLPKGINKRAGRAKERVIPIHDSLEKVLRSLPRKNGPIFGHFSNNMPRRLLIRITKKAGIKGLTRLHELRHSYATFLLNKGVDIYKIKELLGHSDIRDTMKYAHLPTAYMKEEIRQLEDLA
ncbi:MAG: site-specific integrase [Candidatus Omnitrophica bacterium]|nr:site-specific integrase [Candidatus Omnitrophota bacterium]